MTTPPRSRRDCRPTSRTGVPSTIHAISARHQLATGDSIRPASQTETFQSPDVPTAVHEPPLFEGSRSVSTRCDDSHPNTTRHGQAPTRTVALLLAARDEVFKTMNALFALALFGIAVVFTIVLVFAIIAKSDTADASDGCDYCNSDDATRLGGGEVACSKCRRRNL